MVLVGEWLVWTVFAGFEGEEIECAAGELSVSAEWVWEEGVAREVRNGASEI